MILSFQASQATFHLHPWYFPWPPPALCDPPSAAQVAPSLVLTHPCQGGLWTQPAGVHPVMMDLKA